MAIIGNQLQSSNYVSDQFSGNGSTVAYTLSLAPASAASIAVYISGLYQTPGVAYTVSGTTLTFTGAPPSGTNNIYVLHHGIQNQNLVPVNGSITPAMLNNANVVYWSVSNNNVGIGNTSPTDLLSVGGTLRAGNTTVVGQLGVTGAISSIAPITKGVYAGYDSGANTNVGIDIVTGASGIGWLDFSNGDSADFKGRVAYNNSTNTLEFGTNAISRIAIDSAGRVTNPYQPMFSGVRNTTPNTLASGNVVLHNVTITDVGSCYSAATGRFTCPVAGRYLVTINGHAENSQPVSHQIRKNGSFLTYEYGSVPSGNYTALSRTAIITCAANDYLDHYIGGGTFWCGDLSGLSWTVMLVS